MEAGSRTEPQRRIARPEVMLHGVPTPVNDAVVKTVHVAEGDRVGGGAPLIDLEAAQP